MSNCLFLFLYVCVCMWRWLKPADGNYKVHYAIKLAFKHSYFPHQPKSQSLGLKFCFLHLSYCCLMNPDMYFLTIHKLCIPSRNEHSWVILSVISLWRRSDIFLTAVSDCSLHVQVSVMEGLRVNACKHWGCTYLFHSILPQTDKINIW